MTNNFIISSLTVTKLYLKAKSFLGYSENAIRTEVWIAIATYAIVAIAKKRLKIQHSLYEILQAISISAFDRTLLAKIFTNENYQDIKEQNYNKLILF